MKRIIGIPFFLVMLYFQSFSQTMEVLSFQILPNDQTARVTDPVLDLNGEKCALIKVVTTENGFAWEGGILGITKVEDKVGEIWLYVPRGAKKLTIKHNQYGVLRNYIYPSPIKEATVYELILGINDTESGKEPEIEWVVINTEPPEADVYIDDDYAGTTPFQQEIWAGKHTYRIEKNFYKNQAGTFIIVPSRGKTVLDLSLEANFGQLSVKTKPVPGASVIIDGQNTNSVTPFTMEQVLNGSHMLELRKEWYKPKKLKFEIYSDSITDLDVELEPNFGILSIEAPLESEIYEYGNIISNGPGYIRLTPGVHSIEAKLYRHEDISRKIEITVNDTIHLNLNFKYQTGILAIQTTPFDAQVFVDDTLVGTSPLTIEEIHVGDHKLRISKTGYADVFKNISIAANDRTDLKETLTQIKKVKISSNPDYANVYIDGRHVGNTPLYYDFNINNQYLIEIKKDNYNDESKTIYDINIVGEELAFSLNEKSIPQRVSFNSEPSGAEFYLYGNKKGITPLTLELSKGKYSVRLKKSGYKPLEQTFTIDETTVNKTFVLQQQNSGLGNIFRQTKGFYWGLGYQQTVFDRIVDWRYKFGMNTKLKITLAPISFEIMPFVSYFNYQPHDLQIQDLTDTDELWHYGTEFSGIVYPVPLIKQFMPYIGLGYEVSNLSSKNDVFKSNISTTSPIFKLGFDMYLGKNVIQAEYKRSGYDSFGDRSKEFYSNSQFTISLIFGI